MRTVYFALPAALGALVALPMLAASCSSSNTGTKTDAGADGGGGFTVVPNNVDCSKKENCYHLVCYDDPNCQDVPDPGNCPVGQVRGIAPDGGPGDCRACTADDCDGLPGFCCGADVCKNTVECGLYICANIEAQCMATTSGTCGFHDLDGDDAFGDCDEAPSDPCCYCKIAVGCTDSKCGVGNWVNNGACAPCTANDCVHPTCMGLNGCPTNCPAAQYFDGVRCRDCASSNQADVIPACKMDGGI